ncbi:MAG: hypothetical protein LBF85_00815 [Tannerella sp.]|jgi:hypothetical protein|nr:hypothetical protein [Tannerella sp.]
MRRYIFLYAVITGWLAAELSAQMPVMKTSNKNIPDASDMQTTAVILQQDN